MISYSWIDNRLNYTGNVALKVPAFTSSYKCTEYDIGTWSGWCKTWSEPVMLPPPIWSPMFGFEGLTLGIDTKLVDTMEIENVVSAGY